MTPKSASSPAIPSPIVPPPADVVEKPVKVPAIESRPEVAEDVKPVEDGAVSRLLGRMSDQTSGSCPVSIPVKKNVFMSTNDLSLSPPKENRLAAMIAVLGGPSMYKFDVAIIGNRFSTYLAKVKSFTIQFDD